MQLLGRADDAVPESSVRKQLDRLLTSSNLRNSRRLARLLRFVVEHALSSPEASPKEYVIGVEVFDRDSSYDPKTDPVVRSEMRRLRFKLTEYYQDSGPTDPVLIDLPKGTYLPRFSWVYPATLDATTSAAISEPLPEKTGGPARARFFSRRLIFPAAVLLLALVTLTGLTYLRWFSAKPAIAAAIAVIPFRDLSPDHSNGLLTQGLTDEIKTSLAQITGIRVIAQVPPEAVPKTPQGLEGLAGQLKVSLLLEGEVRVEPDGAIRIDARLIRPSENEYAWAQTYHTEPAQLVETERQIVAIIANKLHVAVPSVGTEIGHLPPENPQARDLYLRGRFFLAIRSGPRFHESARLFEEAIRIDPNYAKAYAGLADYYALEVANHIVKSAVGLGPGKAAAEKAIALDPQLDQAYAALGLLKFSDWDFPGAAREYRKALQLNPHFAIVHNRLALIAYAQGKFPQAERALLEAQSLDPSNLAHPSTLGELYYYWRRYENAIAVCHQMLAISPKFDGAFELLSRIARAQGRTADSIAFARKLLDGNTNDSGRRLYCTGAANPASGLQMLNNWLQTPEGAAIPAAVVAFHYMRLGDKESSLRFLNEAVVQRDPDLISLKWDPTFDPIRGDVRYKAIEKDLTTKFGR